ncbi:MAG: SAM-dependent methyltransferase [Acidobacteria bacterium]|nr:SAM-dependent methyltransferase [Acidobacteriota bacterium]
MPDGQLSKLPFAILIAIAMVSAAGLAAEILLMRVFSIIEWDLFAWMIISLALLGFGASGTLLAIFRGPILRHYRPVAVTLPAVTALSLSACLGLATRIDWRSLELLWNPSQVVNLFEIYLLLSIPFCCIGMFIGLSFMRWPDSISRLYGADLAGAAAGAIAAVVLLEMMAPGDAWNVLIAFAIIASAVVALSMGRRLLLIPLVMAMMVGAVATGFPPLVEPGEYKTVSQSLRIPEAAVTAIRSSPLGYVQLLESERVPLRRAPGLSLNFFENLPRQKGLFVDGESPIVLNEAAQSLRHVDETTFGAALALLDDVPRRTVIAGASGMPELVRLAQRGAPEIHLIEENPDLVELIGDLPGWGGEILASDRVAIRQGTLRSNLPRISQPLDLIFIPFTAAESGLDPASQVTIGSFSQMVDRLGERGVIAVSTTVETPPRTVPRLLVTIAEALERRGLDPASHVSAIRGWDAATILVRRSPLGATEQEIVREFAGERSFDLIWLPGMAPDEANRFNQLDRAWHHDAARAILTSPVAREDFIERYKFNISPPTDDRPWFGTAMKWRTLAELLRLRGEGGTSLIRSGYPILLLALVQALVAGALLILLPLAVLRRPAGTFRDVSRWRVVLTFGSLGLGFLFIEIVYIHRLTILLGRPLESVTIVLASFLLFSGLGSLASRRLIRTGKEEATNRGKTLLRASLIVAALALLEIPLLMFAGDLIIRLPHAARVVICVVPIAPLAFVMGIPFPTALDIVRRAGGERWVAWAWGINGCASVVSAVLAVLLAIHFGLTAVTVIAALLYVTAGVALGLAVGRTPACGAVARL